MTACGKCPATWTGHRIEHCTACCRTFSGTTAGDKHRTGDHATTTGPNRRRCRTETEMREAGLEPRTHRQGLTVWGLKAPGGSKSLSQFFSERPAASPEGDGPEAGVEGLTEMEEVG